MQFATGKRKTIKQNIEQKNCQLLIANCLLHIAHCILLNKVPTVQVSDTTMLNARNAAKCIKNLS